jgi:hypothetical protein
VSEQTISRHIVELCQNGYISEDEKNLLFEPMIEVFPNDIKLWIEEGLKKYDIVQLRKYFNQYSYLFENG